MIRTNIFYVILKMTEDILTFTSCDPTFELCSEPILSHPPVGDLVWLTLIYYINIILVPSIVILYTLFGERTGIYFISGEIAYTFVFIWLASTIYHILVWTIPALIISFYLIFGIFGNWSTFFIQKVSSWSF